MTLVSVAQMNSQDDIELNFVVIEQLMQKSQASGASLIVFPENFVCFAGGKQRQTAEQFEVIQARLEQLAHRYGLWIVAGTLPCPYRPDGSIIQDGRVRTVSLCISPEKTEARYDKIHLFDVQVGDAVGGYKESKYFEPGTDVVVAKTPFGNIGLMVCYDLRFPELALTLRQQGAHLLTAPAAFTYTTGQMHWQLLLQARAIENQCYVCAVNRVGTDPYCHYSGGTQLIDPYGKIVAECPMGEASGISGTLDKEMLEAFRQKFPVLHDADKF